MLQPQSQQIIQVCVSTRINVLHVEIDNSVYTVEEMGNNSLQRITYHSETRNGMLVASINSSILIQELIQFLFFHF